MAEVKKPIILDETGKATNELLSQLIQAQKAATQTDIDTKYYDLVAAATSVAEVNGLFKRWWIANWGVTVTKDSAGRKELLSRWFGVILDDDRIHGVKLPLFSTSTTAIGELTDDSVGLTCVPSTAITAGQDDFAKLPQFWCVEVAAEKNEDGTHEIYAVEFIDDISVVRSGEHLCWVLQKNTFFREWDEDGYRYFKMRCHAAVGYQQWPQGQDKLGNVYSYIANPKYAAGLDASGNITCGTGLKPMLFTSHNAAVALWRKRGAQYSGASGNLLKWQLAMIWLKYAVKGNSGKIEGCSSYNYQYTAAVSETGVERVLVTVAQGKNFLVGSCVEVGDMGGGNNHGRGAASMRGLADRARIKSIESVTVDGTEYTALNLDNGGTTFDTVADTTYISTMPYYSGYDDGVLGYDGSKTNYTNGHEPGLIQKTEFQNGAYLILSDELWQWGQDADGNYTFDCYTCHDQSKVTTNGTISDDYTKQEDLTLKFADATAHWLYIEDTAVADDPAVLWPKAVSANAGSGTGNKAGFYAAPTTSGLRAAWCCCNLNNGGNAGLPARNSNNGTGNANWNGGSGSPGLRQL